ncbi:hypothetical protein LUZ60_010726 [Juncus effusus]|nr:hypothetical protein LUZ60_010726 [Juncus effusus]
MRNNVLLLVITILCATSSAYRTSKNGCPDKCGNLTIPYPFGTKEGCYRDGFDITCNETYNPPRAFISDGNLQIINISLQTGELNAYQRVSYRCFRDTNNTFENSTRRTNMTGSIYFFSSKRNKFTTIGCYNLAYIIGEGDSSYASDSAKNGSCEGIGCCQTAIPQELNFYRVSWGSRSNKYYENNPCTYAVLVQHDLYNFSTTDLEGTNFLNRTVDKRVPVMFDWAIRNDTCQSGSRTSDYACLSDNSYCYNTDNGKGYLCSCSEGYAGNPYLIDGCEDIDECKDREKYPCHGKCTNKPGNYTCECPTGKRGDAKAGHCSDKFPIFAQVVVGISGAIVIILAIIFLIIITLQKRKYETERQENYRRNGGAELQNLIASKVQTIQVFTENELEKFTNNFSVDRIIGSGGRGDVYLGTLEDTSEVAIKKSKIIDDNQKEEFANEIITLSQINHRHVVRLLGCCLEVKTPMLVYEYIPNGTLFSFLHGKNRRSISLGMRMKIAKETIEALSTMHYSMNCRILHGDIKSLNILLDNEFRVKVSDFGGSSLVPLEGDQFVEFIQGTAGYLDPECLYTRELTEKSDVYSFGVVLLELITRKPAIYSDGSGEKKSLVQCFVPAMKENRLESILDNDIVNENTIGVLRGVAELALKCLNFKGEDRPKADDLAESLQALIKSNHDLMVFEFMDRMEAKADLYHEGTSYVTTDSAAFLSTQNRSTLHIEEGR